MKENCDMMNLLDSSVAAYSLNSSSSNRIPQQSSIFITQRHSRLQRTKLVLYWVRGIVIQIYLVMWVINVGIMFCVGRLMDNERACVFQDRARARE